MRIRWPSGYELSSRSRPADSRNARALADLGEYYYSAPGVVAAASTKSETVAAELDRIDPARADELRGRIAEQRKDYGTAEREYKQAITASAQPAFQWMALASFYRERSVGRKWNRRCAAERARRNGISRRAWRSTTGLPVARHRPRPAGR